MTGPDHTRRETTDLWAAESRDCTTPPIFRSHDHAFFVRAIHAGHAGCAQFVGAQSYLTGCSTPIQFRPVQ
ncbi:hypothetical protein ACIBCD_15055 [Nocardia brasiliensis]|uniref:hypothetical protein n=1 Tax=Nocardia brasiliensis TaxID=37326 RepID=UPI0004A6EE38|nr:hypothetical protein [Nocardia brasiliensis]